MASQNRAVCLTGSGNGIPTAVSSTKAFAPTSHAIGAATDEDEMQS